MKLLEKISIIRNYIAPLGLLFFFCGCALKTPAWYMKPQNPNDDQYYCGYGVSKSQMEAKTIALDDLIQSVAIKIDSFQQRKSVSGISNGANFTKIINVENILKQLNDFHIKTFEMQRDYFHIQYFLQVCTSKESIVKKFQTIIDEEFGYIDQNWESTNFQNKRNRESLISKIETTFQKIALLQVIQKGDEIDYNLTNQLIEIKKQLQEKRAIKVVSKDYYKIGIEAFLTQFDVTLKDESFHYVFETNFDTTFKYHKKTKSDLVKLEGTLKLVTTTNKVLLSYTYITVGEAKSKNGALQNAFKKFKEHINTIPQFKDVFKEV